MNILLAVDGSIYSQRAARLLARLPFKEELKITVLHVIDMAALTQPAELTPLAAIQYGRRMRRDIRRHIRTAERLAARTAKRLATRWPRTKGVVVRGDPAEQILARAKREKADLILLGSRGLSDIRGFLLGSVSQQVATYAPCSVMIVKHHPARVKRLMVTVDGSRASDDVVGFLIAHLQPAGVEITILYVYHPDYIFTVPGAMISDHLDDWLYDTYTRLLESAGFAVDTVCVKGHSAAKIIEAARRRRADLIVMGSRGLTGLKRLLLGSVSQQVVRHSPVSVLVVRGR